MSTDLVKNAKQIMPSVVAVAYSQPITKLIPVQLGVSADIEIGQEVAFCGFPFGGSTGGGFSPSVTRGIVSAFRPRRVGELDLVHFQLDALTMEGNSGAPLFRVDNGKTVGMIGARFDPLMLGNIPQVTIGGRPLGFPTNIGFAIPSDAMKCVIDITIQSKPAQQPAGGDGVPVAPQP